MHRSSLCSLLLICLALVACTTDRATGPAPATTTPPRAHAAGSAAPTSEALRTAHAVALAASGGQRLGGTLTVLGTWEGHELDAFLAMLMPFQEATGISVLFEGTRNLDAVLARRVGAGQPPDLAGLPGPGPMAEFARQGALVDLQTVLDMPAVDQQYPPTWQDLGRIDGKLAGVFIRVSVKGLIWYNPRAWQAQELTIPDTWEQLMARSRSIAARGTAPWCLGLESGAASGWPGTDWIETIVLRQQDPQVYDAWTQGELAWTSPEIRQAWETWGAIATDPALVFGGPATARALHFGEAGDPLFSDPPGCYMYQQASFITDFFQQQRPGLVPGDDFNFFRVPPFAPDRPETLIVAGDLFGMFKDTPQARALLRYLVTPEAQAIWVARGGAISPNTAVPLTTYPDPVSRNAAALLRESAAVRFDASDVMPRVMNTAFWQAVLDYTATPDQLDAILQNLDLVQQAAYRR